MARTKEFEMKKNFLDDILMSHPEDLNLRITKRGYVKTKDIIENSKGTKSEFSMEDLIEIVESDNDHIYSFEGPKKEKIRALKGHTIKGVEVGLLPVEPPELLFYGISTDELIPLAVNSDGLKNGNMNYVYLADTYSGINDLDRYRRKSIDITLVIHSKQMFEDGYIFFKSGINTYRTKEVPLKYVYMLSKISSVNRDNI